MITEVWIAPGGSTTRKQLKTPKGLLVIDELVQGPNGEHRIALLGGPPTDPTDASAPSTSTPHKRYYSISTIPNSQEGPPSPQSTDPGHVTDWWSALRRDITSGKAHVLGTEKVAGQQYWHVRSQDATFTRDPSYALRDGLWVRLLASTNDPAFKRTTDALLRIDDYRPIVATVTIVEDQGPRQSGWDSPAGSRYSTMTSAFAISTWETLPTSAVPRDTFDLSSIPLKDALTLDLQFLPNEVPSFKTLPVWGLKDRWSPSGLTRKLEFWGTYVYTDENHDFASPAPERVGENLYDMPPRNVDMLGRQKVEANWSNGYVRVYAATFPRVKDAVAHRFAAAKAKVGRSVSIRAVGLRFEGAQAHGDGYSATVIAQTPGATLVVAVHDGSAKRNADLLRQVLSALERKNP